MNQPHSTLVQNRSHGVVNICPDIPPPWGVVHLLRYAKNDIFDPPPPCYKFSKKNFFLCLTCYKISDPPSPLKSERNKWTTPYWFVNDQTLSCVVNCKIIWSIEIWCVHWTIRQLTYTIKENIDQKIIKWT